MNDLLNVLNEIFTFPEMIINKCTFLPDYISIALLKTIYFVPVLVILYYLIGLIERYYLKNIRLFVNLLRNFRGLFSAATGIIPECNFAVLTSIFYSRNMITRGTLFAGLIMCSDEALPLLFIEPSKAWCIVPLLSIKFVLAIAVAFIVDVIETILNLRIKHKDELNSMNTDIEEAGCCHHILNTTEKSPNILKHSLIHTVNIFMFVLLSLVLFHFLIQCYGAQENLAYKMLIDSPIQIFIVGAVGIISNCAISVLIVIAYVLGLISFPAFLAGMITANGLGLYYIYKRCKNTTANLTSIILYISAVLTGLVIYYNIFGLGELSKLFIR